MPNPFRLQKLIMLCFMILFLLNLSHFLSNKQYSIKLPVPARRGARLEADLQTYLQKRKKNPTDKLLSKNDKSTMREQNINRNKIKQQIPLTAQDSSSRRRSIQGSSLVAAAFSEQASFSPTTTVFFSSSFTSFLPSADPPN